MAGAAVIQLRNTLGGERGAASWVELSKENMLEGTYKTHTRTCICFSYK